MASITKGTEDLADSSLLSAWAKLYEIRLLVGKGLGVFAVRDIKRGTIIMYVKPLIHLPLGTLMNVPCRVRETLTRRSSLVPITALPATRSHRCWESKLLRKPPIVQLKAVAASVKVQAKVMVIYETNTFEAAERTVMP